MGVGGRSWRWGGQGETETRLRLRLYPLLRQILRVRVAALANVVDKQNIKQGTLEIYKGDISI